MNIVMFTNTFSPHVGGVARSVSELADGLRDAGHNVLVIAPEFPNMPLVEDNVIRIPALQRFAGTDFSVPIPASRSFDEDLDAFAPDIVHSHHPFLLGGTALRIAATRNLPVVFTYHTRYELYGAYALQDSQVMMRLALSLSLGYADLCDAVIAPSQSMADFICQHKVKVPVQVIPTGVKASEFNCGDGSALRREIGIPSDAFVVGHVGRLAIEKNLNYLTDGLIKFLKKNYRAYFLVAGGGALEEQMRIRFANAGLKERLHMAGVVQGRALANIYGAMDVFAFSSHSETQGLVLAEAMTASVPVVALDAPGVREIVENERNGLLLASNASSQAFADALAVIAKANQNEKQKLRDAAKATSKRYTHKRYIQRAIKFYSFVLATKPNATKVNASQWEVAMRSLGMEWDIIGNVVHALSDAVLAPDSEV